MSCAGELSVVIVIENQHNLVSSAKGNTIVNTKKIKNV